jgi:hypothetical protein
VRAGEITIPQALRKIRRARRLAADLEKDLSALGFGNARVSLSRRFRQCQRAAESGGLTGPALARLATLQLTMHHLNRLLAGEFYG